MVLFLLACGVTKNNFADRLQEASCHRLEECAKGEFDDLYTSVDDCIARTLDDSEALSTCLEGHCSFDSDNADQCVDRVKTADCDEIVDYSAYSDCAEVWSECDGSEGECLDTTTDDTGTTPGG